MKLKTLYRPLAQGREGRHRRDAPDQRAEPRRRADRDAGAADPGRLPAARPRLHERAGVRQLTRCLQAICRKVALGLETGDASLVRERIGARQLRAYLGEPAGGDGDGLERMRPQLDALPPAVRERGRQALDRLSLWAPADPEHARTREYLACLSSVPWTARTEAPLDLARAKAVLDAGHAGHAAVKERLVDYIAMRQRHPDVPSPAICLAGPQAAQVPKEGPSAWVTMAAALVSALTGRPLRGDVAMTGEIGLGGQVLPVGGVSEKMLAAHRCGLARVILPQGNRNQVDVLGDDLRGAVAVDYVVELDELLTLVLRGAPAADALSLGGRDCRRRPGAQPAGAWTIGQRLCGGRGATAGPR